MSQFDLSAFGVNTEVKEDSVVALGGFTPTKGTYAYRLVGVVECGERPEEFKGEMKIKNPVHIFFQLFSKKIPESQHVVMRIQLNKSFTPSGKFLPTFQRMNHQGTAKNYFQLLNSFGRIDVVEYTKQNGDPGVKLDPNSIKGPLVEILDADGMGTGEYKTLNVPEATVAPYIFQWETGNQAQFDTLPYWLQEEVAKATDFMKLFPNGASFKEPPKKKDEGPAAPQEAPKAMPVAPAAPKSAPAAAVDDSFEF